MSREAFLLELKKRALKGENKNQTDSLFKPAKTTSQINEDKEARGNPESFEMNWNDSVDPLLGDFVLEPSDDGCSLVLKPDNQPKTGTLEDNFGPSTSKDGVIENILLSPMNENFNETFYDVDDIFSLEVETTDINKDDHDQEYEGTSVVNDNEKKVIKRPRESELDRTEDDPTYKPSEEESDLSEDEPISNNEERISSGNEHDYSKEVSHKRKRARKGKVEKRLWTANLNKERRCKGEKYYGRRKTEEGKIVFDVEKPQRILKARCSCLIKNLRSFACTTVSETMRQNIFKKFYGLNKGEKKIFVSGLIDKKIVVQRKVEASTSRRNYSLTYFLKPEETNERVKVCKKMFLNTLDIGEWAVLNWVSTDESKSEESVADPEGNAITKETGGRCRPAEGNDLLKEFLDALPKLESHYCRKSTNKLYLEPKWQYKAELYREYKDFCKAKNKESLVTSIFTFQTVFDDMNLALFSPKKDQCDTCCSYKVGNLAEEEYQQHMKSKEVAREEKERDKANTDIKTAVFTMDLQAVLLSPSLQASALYYRTKLKVHNFTLFDLKTSAGFCYLWDETEGGLNADEFASILYHFLTNEIDLGACNHVMFFSDGCTYQNRNAIVANALLLASHKLGIVITQKFLEKGHTQMECDSMHSCIERRLKNREIYSPAAYTEACRTARLQPSPYKVQYLKHSFFLKFSDLHFISSIRPGTKKGDPVVTNLKCIKYTPGGGLEVKLDLKKEFFSLPRRIKSPTMEVEVNPLYSEKIALQAVKFKHLQEMKCVLPREVHNFYDTLPHYNPKSTSKVCQRKTCACVSKVNVDF